MFNDTLSRREALIMSALFTLSEGKERFLVSPNELLSVLPSRARITEEKLERILYALALDGFFSMVESERKGARVYVFHMKEAGRSFERYGAVRRRRAVLKIVVTILCGILSALVGVLVKSLLS